MMEILRNMWRRKFRTLLTVVGIAVGIFAFTVMGSMALRFNKMIAGGKSYITGQITVVPKGASGFESGGNSMLPIDTLTQIKDVEGVEAIAAGVELPLEELDPNNASLSFGPPPTIEGFDLNSGFQNRNWKTLKMLEGTMLKQGDPNTVVVIGISIATDKKLHAGDTMKIRGRDFTVQGVIDRTMTGPDTYVMMPITPAREMLIDSNPFLKSLKEQADSAGTLSEAALARLPKTARDQLLAVKTFKTEDVNTAAAVSWKDGQDPETIVKRIKDQFGDKVVVLSPKAMGELIDKGTVIFNAVILGSALIALIVGGFSIINTMVMSISERTKEIGIKKAMGASRRAIASEYTLEAGVIGVIGGIIGLGFGILLAVLLNKQMASKGAEIFLLDPWYLAGVALFSFALGVAAGFIPAIRAARLKAVDAIREL